MLLDLNELAEGHEFFSLGGSSVSPDDRLLAYSTDTIGDERYTVRVKDLATGELLADEIDRRPGRGHLEPRRPRPLLLDRRRVVAGRQDLAAPRWAPRQADDELVHHEPDGRFWVGVGRSRTDRFIVDRAGSKTTTEYRYLDADDPEAGWRVFAPRREGVEYDVEHAVIGGEDVFLVLHNAHRPRLRARHRPHRADRAGGLACR